MEDSRAPTLWSCSTRELLERFGRVNEAKFMIGLLRQLLSWLFRSRRPYEMFPDPDKPRTIPQKRV